MGAIADKVRSMRGCSLGQIVAEIERMEQEAGLALDIGPSDFEEWWRSWPLKEAKKAAEKAYRTARRRKMTRQFLLDAAQRYVAEKPIDRPFMQASTFLNGERWNDVRPVAVKGAGLFEAYASTLENHYDRPSREIEGNRPSLGRLPDPQHHARYR